MDSTRRHLLSQMLFGSGMLGLRSLATGIPAAILANPLRALADPAVMSSCTAKPQYLIFSTSGNGDAVNAGVPGSYVDSRIMHPQDPSMAPTALSLGQVQSVAAAPWATLPANVLARSCFFHHATGTVVHSDETNILGLNGAVQDQQNARDMLISMLGLQLAPCLGTVQTSPMSLGTASTQENIVAQGTAVSPLRPTALAQLLLAPYSPLSGLEARRQADLQQLSTLLKAQATPGQAKILDQYIVSQQQINNISQSLLQSLSTIHDDSVASQLKAAIVMIQMKIAPVITVHIPFGGDNHDDPNFASETKDAISGVGYIKSLMAQLAAAGLQDQVTFALLNVFGRTLSLTPAGYIGRDHNGGHNVGIIIGSNVQGSVVGGVMTRGPVAPGGSNFGRGVDTALPINSQTGLVDLINGDIRVADSMGAFGFTLGAALGLTPTTLKNNIAVGKIVTGAIAS